MTTLTELRKLAEAATPGPWRTMILPYDSSYLVRNYVEPGVAGAYDKPNCDYIAAFSPHVVLAMIDVIEAAKVMFEAGGVSDEDCAFEAALARLEQEQSK